MFDTFCVHYIVHDRHSKWPQVSCTNFITSLTVAFLHNPDCNGVVERVNRTMKAEIRASMVEESPFLK